MTTRRYNPSGGGGMGMGGFPPFTGAVRSIILVSAGIYVVILLLSAFAPALAATIVALGTLSRETVLQGWVWQFLSYGFVNVDPLNFVLSMLGVYFLGGAVEAQIGSRRFVQLYLSSLIVAGMLGFALSLTGVVGSGPALGPGAAANAILMVFFLLNRDATIIPIPIPIPVPVRFIVFISAGIETAYLLLNRFALFYLVLLLGLGAGYLWFAVVLGRSRAPARGFAGRGLSDRAYVPPGKMKSEGPFARMKNAYYRWKRKRAARKFEVYMRDHDRDVKFDEHGNYIPPTDEPPKKGNGEDRGGWVN
ncbi:MAG: rhomboid family intramembrane serine protease [Acidobacteriota bacterium]|nr:rhomboid family intramembrane serine protease [Acidobacteriota bacterium]